MSTILNIGLDFDEVQYHSHCFKPQIARELFGVVIPAEDFEREKVVPSLLTAEQYDHVGCEVFRVPRELQRVHLSLMYTNLLLRSGHQLTTITSRSGDPLRFAKELLERDGLSMPIVGVGYGVSKTEACRELEIDVYVDDDLRKLTPLEGIVEHRLLFTTPQNWMEKVPEGIIRVADWHGVYNHLYYEIEGR